jgi:hypothetical protein
MDKPYTHVTVFRDFQIPEGKLSQCLKKGELGDDEESDWVADNI